jgi:hypothetical protein
MTICIKDTITDKRLLPWLSKKVNPANCDGKAQLNIQTWAMKEMNVPAYPEIRIYKKIMEHWKKEYPEPNASFIIYDYSSFGKRTEVK